MSPKYPASDWCHKEGAWFKAQFESRWQSPGRVFVVHAVSTNTDKWPDFLKDKQGYQAIGFQFHRETTDEGIEPYCYPYLSERPREFNESFTRLRTTLIKRLEQIKASANRAPPRSLPPQRIAGRQLLYLYDSAGADGVRTEVESELRQEGYAIVPSVPQSASNSLRRLADRVERMVREVAPYCHALTLLRERRSHL